MEAVTGTDQGSRLLIAARLRSDIEAGAYAPGAKLPSYRQLATDFGAARNTVMEAVQQLAREGLVTIRPQSGAVVSDPSQRTSDPTERLEATRADLLAVQGELRAIRRAVDGLEHQVADLIGRLAAE
jgi:DNA-binding FadR family transcriptional regulator